MLLSQRFRTQSRIAAACLIAVLTTACATRHPETTLPLAPIARSVVWRIEEGDIVRTKVFRNPDLNAEPTVSPEGTAFFPGLGRIMIAGIALDSLENLLNARYATLVREPAVQVTMTRDLTMYGEIRSPGVYAADPGATLLSLMARAGGPSTVNSKLSVTLETADGRRLRLPGEARLGAVDLHRTDAIRFTDENFFTKNAVNLQATQIIVTTITSLIGIILLITR